MINKIKEKLENYDIKIQVLPIDCLKDLKEDINILLNSKKVNSYQKNIMKEKYILDLPNMSFKVNSIIAAIVPMSVVKVNYHYKGIIVDDIFNYLTIDVEKLMIDLFRENNLKLESMYWIPLKRLIARCGLGEFGRNNIIYAKDCGSFVNIFAFFSDLEPLDNEYIWEDVKNMEICKRCKTCINNCPTGAITEDRFLINNELCMMRYKYSKEGVEQGEPIADCFFCQDKCTQNIKRLKQITEIVNFNEEETTTILNYKKGSAPPKAIFKKLKKYGSDWAMDDLPRKIKDKLKIMNVEI